MMTFARPALLFFFQAVLLAVLQVGPCASFTVLSSPSATTASRQRQQIATTASYHSSSSRATTVRLSPLFATDDDEEEDAVTNIGAEIVSDSTTNATASSTTNATKKEEIPTVAAVPPSPSPAEDDEEETAAKDEEAKAEEPFDEEKSLTFLQTLGAIAGRGEFATDAQKAAAGKVVASLENHVSGGIPVDQLAGTWELVYCSTQLFRSSPFFMAGRAVCTTDDAARQYNWFCDMHRKALAVSNIRSVRQVISDTRLVSEFEVSAGAVPFLSDFTKGCLSYSGGWPVTIDGALVSSADVTEIGNGALEIYMDTVEIKGSNVPGLRQLLDAGLQLRSRELADLLEGTVSGYTTPRPVFRTTYLSEQFRISRDEDDNIFVYVKTSESTEPTDYSAIDSDLGVAKLLAGFNDAVTKIYL